jgi:hypothetical protein
MVWYGMVWYTICDTQNMYIIVWICSVVRLPTVAYMQKMLQGLSWICHMQTWEFFTYDLHGQQKQAPSRIE